MRRRSRTPSRWIAGRVSGAKRRRIQAQKARDRKVSVVDSPTASPTIFGWMIDWMMKLMMLYATITHTNR